MSSPSDAIADGGPRPFWERDGSSHDEKVVFIHALGCNLELWDAIVRQLNDEKEYIVASLSFVRGLKPNQIHAQHPEQFVDVAHVYRLKHSIVERLRRRYQLSRDGWTGTHAVAKARQRS